MNTHTFSPILRSSKEALTMSSMLSIPFSIPLLSNYNDVKHMQISMVSQQTNKTAFKVSSNYSFPFTAVDQITYCEKPDKQVLTIDLNKCNIEVGQMYKVQIRFGYCDLFSESAQFTNWKNAAIANNDFSEWSTVMIVKIVDEPQLLIDESQLKRGLLPLLSGQTQFSAPSNETVARYRFQITGILDTGWLTHKADDSLDTYQLTEQLESGILYTLTYSSRSINGYEASVSTTFTPYINTLNNLTSTALIEQDVENACNILRFKNLEQMSNYQIVRSLDGVSWTDLFAFQSGLESALSYDFVDFSVANGQSYYYGLQKIYANGRSNVLVARLKDGSSKVSPLYLEYIYLIANGRQLKLSFDTKIGSFKHTVLASKQDTLGSKYPLVMRNGDAYYAEFPISATISMQDDEQEYFYKWQQEDDEPYYNLTDTNRQKEFEYRSSVESFLNDGQPKLFRSATEGNFIVSLMNVSFSPNDKLGRMIASVSMNAYEIADSSANNISEYSLLGQESAYEVFDIIELGGTLKQSTANLFNDITSTKYQVNVKSIQSLWITAGGNDVVLTINNNEIIVLAGRTYRLPQPIDASSVIKISMKDGSVVDYVYSAEIVALETISTYTVTPRFGQVQWQNVNASKNLFDEITEGGVLSEVRSLVIDGEAGDLFVLGYDNGKLITIELGQGGSYNASTEGLIYVGAAENESRKKLLLFSYYVIIATEESEESNV